MAEEPAGGHEPMSEHANSFPISVPWWFTERVIRSNIEAVAHHVRGRLLDIGCGHKRYRDLFQVDHYVGLEPSTHPAAEVVADARFLPFAGAQFDSLLSTQVLEHINDP